MTSNKQDIINEIAKHFKGTDYSKCYVGLAKDVDAKLFSEHNVLKMCDKWIYQTAKSDTEAKEIKIHFLGQGMDGGYSEYDDESKIVYAYTKTPLTRP